MEARIPRIVDSAMLSAAIVIGAALAPIVPFAGVPIAAAGIAGLAYSGRMAFAAGAAVAGAVLVGVLGVFSAAFVAPVLVAIMAAVVMLRSRSVQTVAALLVGVTAVANLATDALYARSRGTTLPASLTEQSNALVANMAKTMGTSASTETLRTLKEFATIVASAWPSAYFQAAVLISALVIVAIAWAAKRVGNPLDIGSFATLDLTPHILWAFVLGLLLLAVSYASFAGSVPLGVVGLNLVLCARTLFFVQGFSVVARVLDRAGVGLGGRILALAALAVLDALTLVVSFTGLLDFWINFRRLPRDGATPTTAEPDSRRW